MSPRHPEHRNHQHHKRAPRLPLVHAAIGRGHHGLVPQLVEPAPFQNEHEIEHPKAEQHVQAGEVGKENGKQAHGRPHARKLRVYRMPPGPVNGKARKIRQKVIDAIPRDHAKCQREPDPEQAVVHKPRQGAFPASRRGHHVDEGRHCRKGQAFVLHPLLSKNHGHARQHHKCGGERHEPPEQGQHPHAPRDGRAFGPAFKKPSDAVARVARNQKIGQMRMQQLRPIIVCCGVKVRRGNVPDQVPGAAPRGQGRAHEAHRQNGVPFPRQEREPRQPAHDSQDDEHGDKRDEHRHWNVREHHPRPVVVKPNINGKRVEHHHQEYPQPDCPRRDPTPKGRRDLALAR